MWSSSERLCKIPKHNIQITQEACLQQFLTLLTATTLSDGLCGVSDRLMLQSKYCSLSSLTMLPNFQTKPNSTVAVKHDRQAHNHRANTPEDERRRSPQSILCCSKPELCGDPRLRRSEVPCIASASGQNFRRQQHVTHWKEFGSVADCCTMYICIIEAITARQNTL